jgi:uncharacterized SAM-binding protein YcdF (DUF218 family)
MGLVLIGYICGIFHKLIYLYDLIILLYIFNAVMIALDLFLYYKFSRQDAKAV